MQFLCCPILHSSSTSTPRNPLHLGGAHSVDLPMEFSVSSVFFGQKAAWSSIHCRLQMVLVKIHYSCRIPIPKPISSAFFDTPLKRVSECYLNSSNGTENHPPFQGTVCKTVCALPSKLCARASNVIFLVPPFRFFFIGNPSSSIWWLRTRQSA